MNPENTHTDFQPTLFVENKSRYRIFKIIAIILMLLIIIGLIFYVLNSQSQDDDSMDSTTNETDQSQDDEESSDFSKDEADQPQDNDENIDNNSKEEQSYKDSLVNNLKASDLWEEEDQIGNRMNIYTMNLILNADPETNYDVYQLAYDRIMNYLNTSGWIESKSTVEGNSLIITTYTNPKYTDRSITITNHASVGSPTLEIKFNYLASDKL